MLDTEKGQIDWVGYMCPSCRFVFRANPVHAGRGIVCPACEHLLAIPEPEEEVQVLTPPDATFAPSSSRGYSMRGDGSEESEPSGASVIPGAGSLGSSDAKFAWDGQEHERGGINVWLWLVPALVIGGALLMGVWGVFLGQGSAPTREREITAAVNQDDAAAELSEEALREQVELLMQEVFEAKDVETLAALVRKTPSVKEHIRHRFPDGKVSIKHAEMTNLLPHQSLENVYVVAVAMGKREQFWGVIERKGDEFLLDWDSFTRWSESSIEELIEQKPTRPVLMRVFCVKDSFYSWAYPESEWQCYRLYQEPGGAYVYGYLPVNNHQLGSLVPYFEGDNKSSSATLRLRYNLEADSPYQVEVDEVVSQTWFVY